MECPAEEALSAYSLKIQERTTVTKLYYFQVDGYSERKKKIKGLREGCKPTAHVRNNSKIYSKGQTAYQKSS